MASATSVTRDQRQEVLTSGVSRGTHFPLRSWGPGYRPGLFWFACCNSAGCVTTEFTSRLFPKWVVRLQSYSHGSLLDPLHPEVRLRKQSTRPRAGTAGQEDVQNGHTWKQSKINLLM